MIIWRTEEVCVGILAQREIERKTISVGQLPARIAFQPEMDYTGRNTTDAWHHRLHNTVLSCAVQLMGAAGLLFFSPFLSLDSVWINQDWK